MWLIHVHDSHCATPCRDKVWHLSMCCQCIVTYVPFHCRNPPLWRQLQYHLRCRYLFVLLPASTHRMYAPCTPFRRLGNSVHWNTENDITTSKWLVLAQWRCITFDAMTLALCWIRHLPSVLTSATGALTQWHPSTAPGLDANKYVSNPYNANVIVCG